MLQIARLQGITIRYEYLDGHRGGVCWFEGRYWLFVDLTLSVAEQVDQVDQALEEFTAESSIDSKLLNQAA